MRKTKPGAVHKEPSTPFDYDALDVGAEEIRERRESRAQTEDRARLTLEILTDFLFARRLAPKEMLARLAALGIARGHYKFTGKSKRWIAKKFGISHSAVARLVRDTVPRLRQIRELSKKRK